MHERMDVMANKTLTGAIPTRMLEPVCDAFHRNFNDTLVAAGLFNDHERALAIDSALQLQKEGVAACALYSSPSITWPITCSGDGAPGARTPRT